MEEDSTILICSDVYPLVSLSRPPTSLYSFLSLARRAPLSSLVSRLLLLLPSFRMLLRATATAGNTTTDRLHPADDERRELTIRQFKSTRSEPSPPPRSPRPSISTLRINFAESVRKHVRVAKFICIFREVRGTAAENFQTNRAAQ